MQILNFVPEDYMQKKLARQANLLCGLLAAIVVVALAVVFVLIGFAEEAVEAERQGVRERMAGAAADVERWNQLQAERQALLGRARRAARLLDPLPRSRVLAEVVRSLPEKTALTELSIDEQIVRRIETAQAAPGDRKSKRSSAAAPQPAAPAEFSETRFRLTGLAPTDVQVARLIATLSNSAYFTQVELSFSEDQVQNEHVLRRFEVLFRLSENACRLGLEAHKKEGRS